MEYNKQMAWKMIAGLGNPGPDYENTYHNIGLIALDYFLKETAPEDGENFRKHGDSFEYKKNQGRIFIRPLVFMNESGLAIGDAAKSFNIRPEEILIFHDESDIPVGDYKITDGGGAAGHKGIQSIIDHLGSPHFSRIRIGIRNPDEIKRKKAGDFVLQSISKKDFEKFESVFAAIGHELAGLKN